MEEMMTRVLLSITFIPLFTIALAFALSWCALPADRTFETEVENSLKGGIPPDWFLRASWRDQTLVVFVSPPVSETFKLWYDANRQKTMLEGVCSAVPAQIWKKLRPDQDVAIEQVVGGNGGKGSWRLSCREYLGVKAVD
jgi:hypothetical protein